MLSAFAVDIRSTAGSRCPNSLAFHPDPCLESAHCAIIDSLAVRGQRVGALATDACVLERMLVVYAGKQVFCIR